MSENYNILNDYDPEQFNLLVPVQSIQEVNPIYRIVVNQVIISTDLNDREIYEEKNAERQGGEPMYALTHKALLKLSTAANGQIVESVRVKPRACEKCVEIARAVGKAPACGSCPCVANVAHKAVMKFPELSGGWRIVQATKEIDFSSLTAAKPGQIARMKEFATEHAESKAISRCIRKGLSIKNAYTLAELEKPFIVAYPVLDARDQDVKKALIAGAIASSNLLYGSGLQLGAGAQTALPEPPMHVDKSTGEIIDAGHEVEHMEMPPEDGGAANPWDKILCNKCGVEIAQNVAEYSTKQFGAPLCMKCQAAARKQGGK